MRGDLGAGVLSMMVRAPHGELTRQKNNVPTIPARSRAAEGTWAAPAPGASLELGIGKNRDRPGHGCAWSSRTHAWASSSRIHDQAEPCCGELETGPAVASLWQGLLDPRGWCGDL